MRIRDGNVKLRYMHTPPKKKKEKRKLAQKSSYCCSPCVAESLVRAVKISVVKGGG